MSDGETTHRDNDTPVTISAPPVPAVTIDPQNPLPEPSFLHRRIIAYVVVIGSLALTYFNLDALHDLKDADNLLSLSKWTIGFSALIATYYYIGPSAAELTAMIQSAKIIKSSLALAGTAATNESKATENALDRAESGAERRFQASAAADSPIPAETPVVAPVDNADEPDAAPRGRS